MWTSIIVSFCFSSLFQVKAILSDNEQRQVPIGHVTETETETIKSGQATFHCDGGNSKHLPGAFTVCLTSGHSFQQHSATIQKGITPYMRSTFDGIPIHKIVYRAGGIDEKLLSAIQSDPMVYLVECGHDREPCTGCSREVSSTAPVSLKRGSYTTVLRCLPLPWLDFRAAFRSN